MENVEILFHAIQKKELRFLLRGDEPYKIESSQYAPGAEPTDVGKVLSKVIYKGYKLQPDVKEKLENTLITMLEQTTFDVYIVILYIVSQLFKEKNELSPFKLDMEKILPKLSDEIEIRKEEFQKVIKYPNGFEKINVWSEIERFNRVCTGEYNISLF